MIKLYVDSCVYISFLTNRPDYRGKLKGDGAFVLFDRCYRGDITIVVSTKVLSEVKSIIGKYSLDEEFEAFFKDLKSNGNMYIVRYSEKDKEEAEKLSKTHFADALHLALACREGCDGIVTENLTDFKMYESRIKIYHPLELE